MKAQDHIGIGIKSVPAKKERSNVLLQLFNRQAEKLDEQRFGWMAILIIVQSCLASAASMYIFENKAGDLSLIVCTLLAMGSNALFISQAPAKWCLASFYLSVIINLLFIAINC